jgi:hypothetical protein
MNKENSNRGSGFFQCIFYILKEVMWMANKIFNIRVKNKRDTEANWKKKNPVLLDGEIIIVTTTSGDTRFKVGDGKKTYNQLPFQDQKTRDLIPSVDSSLSSTSTNPVQNKIIKSELDKKAERDVVNTTTNGLMSVADKKKLDGIAAGANKITVDTSLSSTSTNPVQNKIVNDALKGKFSTSGGSISGDVTMLKRLDVKGVLDAHETILAEKDVQCLYDANSRIRLACDSSGAAKITTNGAESYARLKIASPTGNDDATTKKYVDTGLSGKLDKSGGTLTGNLTGKYIAGTWLQTTEATDFGKKPGKIAILDDSGWIYYRTPSELLSDIGGVAINNFIDTIYPIGSIYITTSNTDPMSLFPGTYWFPIYDRFLLGGGSGYKVGSTGGEATHTLTADEMPTHRHSIYYPNGGGPYGDANISYPEGSGIKKTWQAEMCKTEIAGDGGAHNNMPPYLAVYIWKRVTFDEYEAGADGG